MALSGFLQYCAHRSMAFTRLSKKGLANNARLDLADMVFTQITQRSSAFLVSTQMIIFLSNNACLFVMVSDLSPNSWHNLALGLALPPPAVLIPMPDSPYRDVLFCS